jgi:aryl-alcohol dehydrogenase-like predicted oxidoreductase
MRYKLLGKSGLRVSELALGTMTFGEDWGWGASKEECQRIFEAYAAAGGNFIDTANRYTDGSAEKIVGELISADRQRFVLSTKYTLFSRRGDPNAAGSHRKHMRQSLEDSLKRLKTDYIDVYWVHAWDEFTPTEEVMRGLDDLVRAGKVLYLGVSDTPAWIISHANTLAELRGWTPFVGLQAHYSLADRTVERDLLPMARRFELAMTAWGILGSGVLTGKYNNPETAPADGRVSQWGGASKSDIKLAKVVRKIADEIGRSPSQVAINWVRQQESRYNIPIIPVLGTRRLKQIQENLACLDFKLDEAQLGRLDKASPIELGFPHEFLASKEIRGLVYGEFYDQIDNHRQ